MLIILYILFLVINIFILKWLFYLFINIKNSEKFSFLVPYFLLMLIGFIGWSVALYGALILLYLFKLVSVSIILIRLAFIFATLLIISISFFSIKVYISNTSYKSFKGSAIVTFFTYLLLFLFVLYLFWTIFNINKIVVNANSEYLRFIYGSFYGRWRTFFTYTNIITVFLGLISYFINKKYNKLYSAYRVLYMLLAYFITLVWGFFWNVLLPNLLNSSIFSIFGPIGSLWFLYFSVSILGSGIPSIIEEFENMRRSKTFWSIGTIFIILTVLFLIIPTINIYLKIVVTLVFLVIILMFFKLFSFQQRIIGYELKLFDMTITSMEKDLRLKTVLDQWSNFVNKFFNNVDIIVIGKPNNTVVFYNLENTQEQLPEQIFDSSNLTTGNGWFEFPEYLIIYDVIRLPKKLGIKKFDKGIGVYNQLVIYYKLNKNYVSFYYFFKYSKLYLRLLVFAVYMIERAQHFSDILELKVRERTKKLVDANYRMRQAYSQLMDVYEALKKSDEAKTMFLSVVSHQLRTPLSVIQNYVDMLESEMYGDLTPKQRETVQRIKDAVIRLKNLVLDVLQSSRLERGKFGIVLDDVKIADVVVKVFNQLTDLAKRKQLKYSLHIQKGLEDLVIRCDKDKMFEVFTNLIDNAIHYTPSGGSVDVYLYQPDPKWVFFAVKDTGIGIPKNEQHKLFKKFSRLENAKEVRPDGTGIGLYLVKQIVEGHKGRVWFESEEGKGSTFYVALRTDAEEVTRFVRQQDKEAQDQAKAEQRKRQEIEKMLKDFKDFHTSMDNEIAKFKQDIAIDLAQKKRILGDLDVPTDGAMLNVYDKLKINQLNKNLNKTYNNTLDKTDNSQVQGNRQNDSQVSSNQKYDQKNDTNTNKSVGNNGHVADNKQSNKKGGNNKDQVL